MPSPALTDADVERFRSHGFVVLPEAFDPAPLAAEIGGALARGFAHAGANNVSDEAGISFRYLPMMGERTPISLDLLHRFGAAAERLLDGPVLPVRAKAVEYHGGSGWHRDSELDVASVGFACYLDPLTGDTGALRVVPGSHRDGRPPTGSPADGCAVDTAPGDVIVFDEHLLHASSGGGVRRQWRVDYLARPDGPAEDAVVRRYFAAMFSPDWDGGYDVDAFPTYGPHWRLVCAPVVDALLERLGAYAGAAAEEAASRHRRTPTS